MLGLSEKRTHKFWLVFFLGFFVSTGFLVSTPTARAQDADAQEGGFYGTPTTAATTTANPNTAPASTLPDPTAAASGGASCGLSTISGCVVIVIDGVTKFMAWIASGAAALFIWVVEPSNISGTNGILNKGSIYELWKFIRDFFNLFFIFILLLSAFATVFQVENFSIRKIFLNILIAALVINFSFPITRFLIDLANVPMYYFLNAILPGTQGGTGFMNLFLGSSGLGGLAVANSQTIPQALMGLIFTFLFAISLLVLGALMLVRLVALTLLLVLSPFGFAASLMPGMQDLGRQWWSKFWSYAFFGPAAALMLLIAIRFQNEVGKDGTFGTMVGVATNMSAGSPETSAIARLVFYMIPLILIWTAIGMANKFSIAGADKVVGMGQNFSRWTGKKIGKGALGGAKYVGRKVEKRMAQTRGLRWLSPTVLKTAITNRAEEQKHKDEAKIKQGAARVQDTLNEKISRFVTLNPKKWMHKGVDVTNHELEESQHQASEEKKHISDVSTNGDYVINELKDAIANGQTNKADAALQLLAQNNDLNDMLLALGQEYGADVDKETGKVIVSSENMLKVLPKILAAAGEKNADLLAQRMLVIGEKATGSGNYAFGGMVQFNKDSGDHGKFEIATPEKQAAWAAAKVKNLESQKRQTTIHPDSLFTRDSDGKFGDINGQVAQSIISTYTQGDVTESRRSRDDLKAAIHNAFTNINETMKNQDGSDMKDNDGNVVYRYQGFRDAYNNKNGNTAIFKDYVDTIEGYMRAKKEESKSPEVKKAESVAKPGETVSAGGIVIPESAGGGSRKST